jgi:hypothetical protein
MVRLARCDATCCPTFFNVHRLLLTACVVAVKTVCDQGVTNQHMAKVGGVSTHELHLLELNLCSLLQWRLQPTHDELRQVLMALACPDGLFPRILLRCPAARTARSRSPPTRSTKGHREPEAAAQTRPVSA